MTKKKKFKICRRLGPGVYEKCQTQKFTMSAANRKKPGAKRPKALSDFASELLDKQRIRFSYGITEKQFSNYVKDAVLSKGTPATDKLFENLETRLDNVIYRMGIAHTRAFARQMVSHGHFLVNGKRTTVPSYKVKVGDEIKVREGSRNTGLFTELPKRLKTYSSPNWLVFDAEKIVGKIEGKPKNTEGFLNLNSVLEFYSR